MAIQISQPTGVGDAAAEDTGLSGAWLTEPITVAYPASQAVYETTIVDQSGGMGAILTSGATALASITASGKGSIRIRARYRATSTSRWLGGYFVIRVQRDADGTNLEVVAPALLEVPSETAEARGYADVLDDFVAEVNAGGGGSLPDISFTGQVNLGSGGRAEFDDGAADCVLGLPVQPYTVGAQYELTIVDATDLVYPTALDPDGAWDAFAVPYFVAVTATSETTFVSVGKAQAAPGTATPTISGLTVDAGDLDKLVVPASAAVHFPNGDLTGATIGGTLANARTISSVDSGNGTAEITLDLSGDLTITDVPTLVLASNRTLCSLESGVKVAAGSYSIAFTGGDVAWSPGAGTPTLDLYAKVANLQGASHPTAIVDTGPVAAWVPTVGAANFVQASGALRPIYDADGVNGLECIDSDGTNDVLTSTMTVANLIGATSTAFEVIWQGKLDAIVSTASAYNTAEPLIGEAGGYFALMVYNAGGTMYRARGYIYAGATLYAEADIGASLPANGCVIEMRLLAGQLIVSVDGVDGTPQAVGAPVDVGASAQTLKLFGGAGSLYANAKTRRILAKSGSGAKESATITALVAEL